MQIDNKMPSLAERTKIAKQTLKELKIKRAKIKFFDSCYGPILKSKNIKLDNLWAGYTTDEKFTQKLENYVEECKNSSI